MMTSDAVRWLPMIRALTDVYGSMQDNWHFTIFFLSETRNFKPLGSPYFRVARKAGGEGLVAAGLFGSRDFPPGAGEILESIGWRKGRHKYQADFLRDLGSDWMLSDGFWHGLFGAGTLAEVSADDFLHCHLNKADEATVLAKLNPTAKGDYVYHHLDPAGRTIQEFRDALGSAPLDPHVEPRLSTENRESFLARNRSNIPEVEQWTDAMILEAEAHGL